jgi:hypothetical protein
MKITARKIKPYIYILLLAILIASWGWTFIFLNKYFYQAMAQTEKIYILHKSIDLDTVNTEKFKNILDKIDQKTKTTNSLPEIKNPF